MIGSDLKLVGVALAYDTAIASTKLTTSAFRVAGRTITKVYANTSAALADQGSDGTFVIVEVFPTDEAASPVAVVGVQRRERRPAVRGQLGDALRWSWRIRRALGRRERRT